MLEADDRAAGTQQPAAAPRRPSASAPTRAGVAQTVAGDGGDPAGHPQVGMNAHAYQEPPMIQIIPEVIDTIGGRKPVKVTLRDGDNIVDADVLDPLVARQRTRVAQRLAERSGDASATERIEQALL